MSELINQNVFAADKKFVDFSNLTYFWGKTKNYVDTVDTALSGRIAVNEGAISSIQDELNSLSGGAGSIATQINNAIAALKLEETYEAKGDAAKAEAAAKAYADGLAGNYDAAGAASAAEGAAKTYADGLNTAMDTRVKVLEDKDYAGIAADAAAAAVAGVIDDAPESFDTLKEVAAWIANNDHAADVATLMTDVENLKAINHNAYVAADEANLTAAKNYVDGKVDGKFDSKGAAAQALTDAKSYADGLAVNYEVAGAAATAETNAKSYADGKLAAKADADKVYVKETVDTMVSGAQAAAIAQAKLDAAEALKAYYTKTEVDNLLSTNSTGDRAYAKQYTDELFNSIQFAADSDIDTLFA